MDKVGREGRRRRGGGAGIERYMGLRGAAEKGTGEGRTGSEAQKRMEKT